MYRVSCLTGAPKFGRVPDPIKTGPEFLCARDYKGILYLENLRGTSQKRHPVGTDTVLRYRDSLKVQRRSVGTETVHRYRDGL